MLELLAAPHNLPFAVALGVMLGLSALELLSTLLGAGLSGIVDGMLPEFDLDLDVDVGADMDLDADADVGVDHALATPGAGLQLLDWLHVGRVPALILLMTLLGAFGVAGVAVQWVAATQFGAPLWVWLASVPAFLASLPVVHLTGRVLGRILPSDETSAVSRDSFVGKVATVTTGTAALGNPAQARLRDEHGQTHYVLVEPEGADERFPSGSQVILLSQQGAVFKAVGSDLPVLPDGS